MMAAFPGFTDNRSGLSVEVDIYGSGFRQYRSFGLGAVAVSSVLRDRTAKPAEIEPAPASFRWGKPSSFTFSNDAANTISNPLNLLDTPPPPCDPDFEDCPEPEDPEQVYDFEEVDRKVKQRRVTQPGKPENYIDFDDATEITFRGPDSGQIKTYWRFRFKEPGSAP